MYRLVLWNEGSGKSPEIQQPQSGGFLGRCEVDPDTQVVSLDRDLDLDRVIDDAIREQCELVVAAGGDGTVNAAVNSLMKRPPAERPRMAILPLGTANDFAGCLAIPDDIPSCVELLGTGRYVPIDVVKITAVGFERYYANVAAGGNSVRVTESLTDEIKTRWGAFCYVRGAVDVLGDMKSFHVRAQCDEETIELDSWGILVANGRTNAGRILVAPNASPSDGLMDIVFIRDGDMLDMVDIVATTLLSNFLECDQVLYRQARELHLQSLPGMRFTLDGEVIDEEPVHFQLVPAAIQMMVGDSYSWPICNLTDDRVTASSFRSL